MKQFVTLLVAACALTSAARAESPDSIAVASPSPELPLPVTGALPAAGDTGCPSIEPGEMMLRATMESVNRPGLSLRLPSALPRPGVIAGWNSGFISGQTAVATMPGMMAVNRGRLTLTQQLGNVTVAAYGEAVKYGYFRGLTTSWGYGGEITWRPSGQIAFTLFGAYYTPLTLRSAPNSPGLRPEMTDYLSVTRFGGYADISLGENWGVMVGAQVYRETTSGAMEAVPIAAPYYKINGKHKIGIDVGGIAYELLRKHNGWGPKNPTIAPPAHPHPPVR